MAALPDDADDGYRFREAARRERTSRAVVQADLKPAIVALDDQNRNAGISSGLCSGLCADEARYLPVFVRLPYLGHCAAELQNPFICKDFCNQRGASAAYAPDI